MSVDVEVNRAVIIFFVVCWGSVVYIKLFLIV